MHPFLEAAFQGNLSQVQALSPEDINLTNDYGSTALILAAEMGHVDVAHYLLKSGADVHCQNKEGNTALHSAANFGRAEIVAALLAAGSEINIFNQRQQTPLMLATRLGNLKVVQDLLAAGADVHACDPNGVDALLFGCIYFEKPTDQNRLELFKTLHAAGANLFISNAAQNNMLHFCASNGWLECCRFLLEKGLNPNLPDKWGYTPLKNAMSSGHEAVSKLLLEYGAQQQETLFQAISSSLTGIDIIRQILEQGADVNIQMPHQDTILMEAVKRRDPEIVRLILAAKPQLDQQNSQGYTALHRAAAIGRQEIVDLLLSDGADPNLSDQQGNTPLHVVYQFSGVSGIVRALLEYKADFNPLNKARQTPLDLAIVKGHPDSLQPLLPFWNEYLKKKATLYQMLQSTDIKKIQIWLDENAWRFSSSELADAFLKGRYQSKVLTLLLKNGLEPNQKLETNETLFQWALCRRDMLLDIAEILMEAGVDATWREQDGGTVLMVFCGKYDALEDRPVHYDLRALKQISKMIKTLVKQVNPDWKDHFHNIALIWAVRHRRPQDVRVILKAGADPNIRNRAGYTPLMNAVYSSHAEEMVRLLLQSGALPDFKNRNQQTAYDLALQRGNAVLAEKLTFIPDEEKMMKIEALQGFPVVIEFPIAWGDMDAFGHVNNTRYFSYFESSRMAYFEKINLSEIMKQTGIGPILAATNCSFKVPLTYPDTLSVGTRVIRMETDRFTMEYVVYSHQRHCIAAKGEGTIVTYHYQQAQKASMPEVLKNKIEEFEGYSFWER